MRVLTIIILFAATYSGTARVIFGLTPARTPSRVARGWAPLQTQTGPMSTGAVATEILTVPLCLAFFELAAAVIGAIIF